MQEYRRREYTAEDRKQNTQKTREKPEAAEEERKEELTVAIAGEKISVTRLKEMRMRQEKECTTTEGDRA